jgi:secondary thiamine-phosphate synthase enzyme
LSVYNEIFEFETQGEFDFVNLTPKVKSIVKSSKIEEGIAVVYAGHATGVIILNELDNALIKDLKEFLKSLLPAEKSYSHPVNASAHLRSMIFTPSRVIPVHNGRLGLGVWQSLYWIEAERRPRQRRVEVTIVGV